MKTYKCKIQFVSEYLGFGELDDPRSYRVKRWQSAGFISATSATKARDFVRHQLARRWKKSGENVLRVTASYVDTSVALEKMGATALFDLTEIDNEPEKVESVGGEE